jgi:hypothetical protein
MIAPASPHPDDPSSDDPSPVTSVHQAALHVDDPLTPGVLLTFGFRLDQQATFPAYVWTYHAASQVDGDPPTGFRLRLVLVADAPDPVSWTAEMVDLERSWHEGVGFGEFRTVRDLLDLMVGLQVFKKQT